MSDPTTISEGALSTASLHPNAPHGQGCTLLLPLSQVAQAFVALHSTKSSVQDNEVLATMTTRAISLLGQIQESEGQAMPAKIMLDQLQQA